MSVYVVIGGFADALSKFADPKPALAALAAVFQETIGEEGFNSVHHLGTVRIEIPSGCQLVDGYRLPLSPLMKIGQGLDCPEKVDLREKGRPRVFPDRRSAPLGSLVTIPLGRRGLFGCTHRLSINRRFWRSSARTSRLNAIASAV